MNKETDEILIRRILKNYSHENHSINLTISNYVLKNFIVDKNVFNPCNNVSLILAEWLVKNKVIYSGKTVIDMGCGTGILGVILCLSGAKKVIFADLSKSAIKNTKKNIQHFNIANKSKVVFGNLFKNLKESADLIVFNHPFFLDHTSESLLLKKPKYDKAKIIHKFLKEVREHLNKKGIIIMPYVHLAGLENNPGAQATNHKFLVKEVLRKNIPITKGKVGPMSIYRITSS